MKRRFILKKFFNDTNLNNFFSEDGLLHYKVLDASTHYRQISKNIKKIREKFDGNGSVPFKMINIGVIVVQFATSIEEFYSYMFHPTKGLIVELYNNVS
jgi:hypothetical protein